MNSANQKSNMGTAERWLSLALGTEFLYRSLKKHNFASLPAAFIGAGLVYRGAKNYCPLYHALGVDSSSRPHGPDAVATVVIARPAAELYQFWRNFQNAPRFMSHVASVEVFDAMNSQWTMNLPGGYRLEWPAEVTEDMPDSGFKWRSGEGSPINVNGSVRFREAPGGRGTQVIAGIRFSRSGGSLLGKLAGPLARYNAHGDLMRFKGLMETGEIATTHGQTSGRVWAERAVPA